MDDDRAASIGPRGRPFLPLGMRLAHARRQLPLTAEELGQRQTLRRKLPPVLTRHELAARLGISAQYLGDCESGNRRPSLPVLEQLAGALNLPLAELLALGRYTPDVPGMRYVLVPASQADVIERLASYDRVVLLQCETLAKRLQPSVAITR